MKKNIRQQEMLNERRKRVYVYLSEFDKERLKDLSIKEGLSVSGIVSQLIEKKLESVIKLDLFQKGDTIQ